MLFIIIFALLTFALPLSVEIYRHGSNNIVTRVGREIATSPRVGPIVSGFKQFGDFGKGVAALLLFGLAVFLVLQVILWLVGLLIWIIR